MPGYFVPLAVLSAAFILDWFIGDPRRFPHPVRLMGAVITLLEKTARRLVTTPIGLKRAGAVTALIVAGGFALLTAALLGCAFRLHPVAGLVLEIYLLFAMLAGGDLRNHVLLVERALAADDLPGARRNVAMLVSRDTDNMDRRAVSRAALESLFENSADGLVAPLFYAALGGPVLAVFFKAVSTMDSMIGYRTERYRDFGFCAAKVDDVLSFIPSRLTALCIIAAGAWRGRWREGLRVLRLDRRKHDSPNSAWPEAAAAGVLGITFGGTDYHRGEPVERPKINVSGRMPDKGDLRWGLVLFKKTSRFAFALLLALAALRLFMINIITGLF